MTVPVLFWLAPIGSLLALVFAYYFFMAMKAAPPGNKEMVSIASHVKQGAVAYIKQQFKVVGIFFIIAFLFLLFLSFGLGVQSPWVPFAFLTGGFFSGLSGVLGLMTATSASNRTTEAARSSLNTALKIAFRSGAVMGLVVVGLALLSISVWFLFLKNFIPDMSLRDITSIMLAAGIGASFQALFARVGGGIFTKAADVGADLVGKVEAGIPEDDPRNPAVIADNVGDNVGDVAGMGADLYESYYGSILATAALGAAAFAETGSEMNAVLLPIITAGLGIILSIIGIFAVRTKEEASQKELLHALAKGINLSSFLVFVTTFFLVKFLLPECFGIWGAIVTGLIVGIIIGKSAEYYTSHQFKPTRSIAEQSKTGSATVIIAGISTGMISTGIPIIATGIGVLLSFTLSGGFENITQGLYGIGIAAVGMLSTLGITLSTDAYGPIADNAGGNAEMAKLEKEVRMRTDALDALGNTTAATGKGFAIGSAALTSLTLIAAYVTEIKTGLIRASQEAPQIVIGPINDTLENIRAADITYFIERYNVTLINPKVMIGLFLGASLTFFFCALTMRAVGRAAHSIVEEVRRQFREITGLMEGEAEADYAKCVAISTKEAQHGMIFPSLLAIVTPIFVGLLLGVPGVVGLLSGALSSGFVLAIMMANAGGAWDNAKKYIEEGNLGGKGSDCHKASVIGDTVGDPFKDTSGPSLNILIKLMSMISVVVAGLVVKFEPTISKFLGLQ
ncbi:TPA: sodium-translocating pyrophosphatase [bacterium]|nr:sodium-translocating pyrophosphatase [bacterium]